MEVHLLPFFILILFAFVAWEWHYFNQKDQVVFKFQSSVLNISCGIIERIFDVYLFIAMYAFFHF